MKKPACFCALAAVLLSTQTSSFARLEITPSVSLREEYNDNIFLSRNEKDDDYITTITPAVSFQYAPNKLLDLDLDYKLNFRFYGDHNEFNDTSLRDSQNASFQAKSQPLNYLYLDVTDTYQRVPIDVRKPSAEGNEIINVTESNMAFVSPYIKYPLTPSFLSTIGYEYNNKWYRTELRDSVSHAAFLTLGKTFSSKLNMDLKYRYYKFFTDTLEGSDVIRDYDSHRGSLMLTYQASQYFKVDGEVGESKFDYSSGNDSKGTFWNVSSDYDFRNANVTSLGLSYGTSFKDSPLSGVFRSREADLSFKTGRVLVLEINPYYSKDTFLRTDRTDWTTGVKIDLARPLTETLALSLNGKWEKHKFLPEDERVRKYGAGGELNYKVSKSITAGIGYKYNCRNSNNDEEDFNNNIVWLLAKAVF
ncbi:MAG: TIGR03016 family PEP-CTERM system-associated outer membrane protein [Nitrospirae bacterium]|nr:TIGR03016 family PEP-CTERM system-associated outer membrane protein [Nitrospirota bacterium]